LLARPPRWEFTFSTSNPTGDISDEFGRIVIAIAPMSI
jgi:hypothetical protein